MKNVFTFWMVGMIIYLISFSSLKAQEPISKAAEAVAQKQLEAYNARDLKAFLACYADTVKVYNFPDELIMNGKAAMRQGYQRLFDNTPELNCELVNRISIGNKVIDREKVSGIGGGKPLNAVAIYFVKDDLIYEVYFLRE